MQFDPVKARSLDVLRYGGNRVWDYDEITWFAHQSQQYRGTWLSYAWNSSKRTGPNGYL
jgi:hypothetical protein